MRIPMVTRVVVAQTNYVGPLKYQCEDLLWQLGKRVFSLVLAMLLAAYP
jgi:hypothetical protein